MSFDGMEGCLYTGRGEYACSEYVRRVYEVAGSELLSDASTPSHYRWHAHSYHNWGEPYYDYQGRGGMFQYRIHNQEFFRRNLIPGMLGQYSVRLATDKFEATHPENFEFTMAQTVANNAGMGFDVAANVLKGHGLTDYLLERIRLWEDMRFHGVIPEKLREDMKDENANWPLEAHEVGWEVRKLRLQTYDFGYRETIEGKEHCELVMIDRAVPKTTLQMRIRVGQRRQKGQLTYLAFHNGWGGFDPNLRFENIRADAGDYLIYTGGTSIKHYDANYNFLGEIEGIGQEVSVGGEIAGVDVHWIRSEDSEIEPFATVFQAVEETEIPRRRENA